MLKGNQKTKAAWLNKTRLGLIGLNYIGFESTMPRTVHVIFVIFIVRIDNSTCVETNGFLSDPGPIIVYPSQ